MMFSLFVSWQKECEALHRNMDILKDDNSSLTQRLIRLSEECLELSNENDYIQVHYLNPYFFSHLLLIRLKYLDSF